MSAEEAALIERFYSAFARRDGDEMAACYTPDATFSDEVFVDLRGNEVGSMWRMLCSRGEDLKVEHSGVRAEDGLGRAHWDAWYTFAATGRPVHNSIDAEFRFRDGLISQHRDRFDFWRWSRQALGPVGLIAGWSPPLRAKVRGQAREQLDRFMAERPAG